MRNKPYIYAISMVLTALAGLALTYSYCWDIFNLLAFDYWSVDNIIAFGGAVLMCMYGVTIVVFAVFAMLRHNKGKRALIVSIVVTAIGILATNINTYLEYNTLQLVLQRSDWLNIAYYTVNFGVSTVNMTVPYIFLLIALYHLAIFKNTQIGKMLMIVLLIIAFCNVAQLVIGLITVAIKPYMAMYYDYIRILANTIIALGMFVYCRYMCKKVVTSSENALASDMGHIGA